jgi:hypothetical protein
MAVVQQLLERTGIAASVESESLRVTVGRGNWISFYCRLKLSVTRFEASKKLRRGENTGVSVWYRSKGFPSLHFEVRDVAGPEGLELGGHVDAADPIRHPIAHLVRDYLPTHGWGTHPTPDALLSTMAGKSLG